MPNDRLTDIPSSDDVWADSGRAFISRGRGEEPVKFWWESLGT